MQSHREAKNLLRNVYRFKGYMDWDIVGSVQFGGDDRIFMKLGCSRCGHTQFGMTDTCPACGRVFILRIRDYPRERIHHVKKRN